MGNVLDELITMSKALGDPNHDYAILGEGNTSAVADHDSFWVKASGTQLVQACRESFVRVRSLPILAALNESDLDDKAIKELLKSSTVEGARSPSIETFLHALCLQLEDVQFVGHTHPSLTVGLLSSINSRKLFAGSIFPDQIVVLGPRNAYVPYADPGLPLALAVRESIQEFLDREHRVPKVVLMENHGIIALGNTAQEVLNITQMLVKTCRIISGTLAAGGPRFLSSTQVDRIDKRPDELARRKDFK
ncbi:MAG: class II aldolase/adducin family protein [Planctomycetota bacterium]|nr:MAG: class II aldolase/adducin family protein [Planctomycetota bacterium]